MKYLIILLIFTGSLWAQDIVLEDVYEYSYQTFSNWDQESETWIDDKWKERRVIIFFNYKNNNDFMVLYPDGKSSTFYGVLDKSRETNDNGDDLILFSAHFKGDQIFCILMEREFRIVLGSSMLKWSNQ